MRNILLDPGIIPFLPLKETLNTFVKTNKLTIINEKPYKNGWDQLKDICEFITYKSIECNKHDSLIFDNAIPYSNIVSAIINDYRTMLIYERVKRINSLNSLHNGIQDIEILIYNSIKLLRKINPDLLLFQATPHNLPSWVLAKTAEQLYIKVNMIQTSPLPWRFWIVEGLDIQKPVFPNKSVELREQDYKVLDKFWNLNTSDYKDALPSYERKRIESRGGKFWSWKKEFKDGLKHPKIFLSLYYKRKLYNIYNKITEKPDYSQKYIVFFLHYQPERTTLPEWGLYAQQWIIIRQLSMSLPQGWYLYVKEHPSTFTGRYDLRYRKPSFYSDIDNIPNVKLVPLETNTFELIDNSQAVTTVTGTVGVQALMRGKPVRVFGYSSYRSSPFNVYYKEPCELNFLNDIKKRDTSNSENIIKEYLKMSCRESISGFDIHRDNDIYSRQIRINGHVKLLNEFFS